MILEEDSDRIVVKGGESPICKLFERYYSRLNLSNVREITQIGDYLAERNGEMLRIEIEKHLGGFFAHKRKIRDRIDIVVFCQGQKSRMWKERRKELDKKELVRISELANKEVYYKWY